MKTNIVMKCAVAIALTTLTGTACSSTDTTEKTRAASGPSTSGSVQELAAAAGRNLGVDYTPLTSPADARKKADLIVTGTLTKVADGIRITRRAEQTRRTNPYVTFILKVDKVLHGNKRHVADGKVYVAVSTGDNIGPAALSALNPQAKVVAVLDDITTWRPAPDVTVARPTSVPAGARLYAPFTDGFWLQGRQDTQMFGIGAEHTELTAGWKRARTVDQFAASFG